MDTTIIDKDRALELLREVVAEKGEDHFAVDGDNTYFTELRDNEGVAHDVVPNCIIGHCFAKLGVGMDDLKYRSVSWHTGGQANHLAIRAVQFGQFEMTEEALTAWEAAQDSQDSHNPWGRALVEAEQALSIE